MTKPLIDNPIERSTLCDYLLPERLEKCIIQEVDGFRYFWPEADAGYYSSFHLRQIADRLDELNHEWETEIKRYFEDQDEQRGYSSY